MHLVQLAVTAVEHAAPVKQAVQAAATAVAAVPPAPAACETACEVVTAIRGTIIGWLTFIVAAVLMGAAFGA